MYERLLRARLERFEQKSVLVLGPRQVGKSTLLRSLGPQLAIDLSSPDVYRRYVGHPERLEKELRAVTAGRQTVLIDEVQRVPALLDMVQALVDESPDRYRFLLSGSSARKLRRGQANLLPGRVLVYAMHPLLQVEIGSMFELDRALGHGTLPGIYGESDPELRNELLRSYADTYLREEIQAEGIVRDVGGFSRLFDYVAAASGRILNINALSQDAGISYVTARRYMEILEDTLVLWRIPAWSGSDRGKLVAHPKVILFDLGVRNALLRRPLDKPLPDERGLLLEQFVGLEILCRTGSLWPDARLHHFRTRAGLEVDYLLEVGREVWGIEVKASSSVGRADFRGLNALDTHVRTLKRRIVVFLGDRAQAYDGVEVLPLAEFLSLLPA
ncbi:MAG TPA: ATP-binding protein [Candidatus Eisenbacteria bacterium]